MMRFSMRLVLLCAVLTACLLSGWVSVDAQKQVPKDDENGSYSIGGIKELLGAFWESLFVADLILLENGGAMNGRLLDQEFTFNDANSGQASNYSWSDVVMIRSVNETEEISLLNGEIVTGSIETDALEFSTPDGLTVSLSIEQLRLIFFAVGDSEKARWGVIKSSLANQNLDAMYALALTTFDLVFFPNETFWSGRVINESFTFESNTLGSFTFSPNDLTRIELSSDPESQSDILTLATGDRVSGRLVGDNLIQFQPLGLKDDNGQPVTVPYDRGQVSLLNFRLLPSAFGGGSGPTIGGGPGK